MKVAIVGAGIAGSYLGRLLEGKGIHPEVYEQGDHDTACKFRSCGWGAQSKIGSYLARAGLDLSEYLLSSMEIMQFDRLVAATGLCTIDKPSLIRDLRAGLTIVPERFNNEDPDAYDIVADATGIARSLLPPCTSDLVLPTLQHRVTIEPVKGNRPVAGVFGNQIPGLGYIWVFPLGQNQYHIGAGGLVFDRYEEVLEKFFSDLSVNNALTHACRCSGEIRVSSPFHSQPFTKVMRRGDGRSQQIVGVGESIGTVSPFTGEGIVYSLECAEMLADSWPDVALYTSRVLSRFAWMKKERETLDYLIAGGQKAGPRLRDRWRFYQNARRSGVRLPIQEAFRRIGSLTRWIEGEDT